MIDEKIINQIAHLARLTVTPEETLAYIPQIQKILTHFNELSELNTDDVEPLITPVDLVPSLRLDIIEKNIPTEDLMELAPDKVGALFKVPPVI